MTSERSGPLPAGPIDTLGVLDTVLATAAQVSEALGRTPTGPVDPDVDAIVIVPSAACVDAVTGVMAVLGARFGLPVLVSDGRDLPPWVGARTLVVVVSAGEDTELERAMRDVIDVAVVVGVGAGPVVESLAERDIAVLRVGEALAAPRFAVPGLVTALSVLLAPFAPGFDAAASGAAAVAQLHARTAELVGAGEPAARLARRIGRTLPLVYGAGPIGAAAAQRWKHQVNDNAKAASFAGALPALAAHELSGWGQHGDVTRQVFSLVTVRHDHEDPADVACFPAVDVLVDEVVHARHEVVAAGDGELAQLLDLYLHGDLVSYHLAQELEIDPGPMSVDGLVRGLTGS